LFPNYKLKDQYRHYNKIRVSIPKKKKKFVPAHPADIHMVNNPGIYCARSVPYCNPEKHVKMTHPVLDWYR
jgi:hypothetical protein